MPRIMEPEVSTKIKRGNRRVRKYVCKIVINRERANRLLGNSITA